jgi:hypothetical protein
MINARAVVVGVVISCAALGATGCFGRKSSGPAGLGTMCSVKADCPQQQYCVSGVCAHPGSKKAGDKCVATSDCALDLYCGDGVCSPGGLVAAGGACAADAVCEVPLRCNFSGFFGTCGEAGALEMGTACTASADCLAGLVCGPQKTCLPPQQAYPRFDGVACSDEGFFRAYFEVPRADKPPKDFFRLPFPNDIRVTAGKLDLSDFPKPGPTPLGIDLVQLYVDAWTQDFEGFSSIGVTTFRFSQPIDDQTALGDGTHLIDLTPGPNYDVEYARDWVWAPSPTKYSCANRLTLRNTTDEPLRPGHTYAAILTTAIKSMKGDSLVVDPDMTTLLAGATPPEAALLHAWQVYQPLRDWLKMKGAKAPPVAAAAVFTVQDAPGHVQRLAAAVAKAPGPVFKDVTVCGPGVKSPCDDGTPARACGDVNDAFEELHGRFSVPIFQKGAEPYETPEDGAGGFVEAAGVPQVQRTEDVCFALSVPKKAKQPAAGWPLVVYHHGTGGSMRSFIDDGVAEKAAAFKTPAVVFGFDAVEHGARRGASTKKPDDLVFNPLNPRAARDNLLQGAADILQAFRVAEQGGVPVSKDRTVVIGSQVAFFGHSQGSTSGALAVAVSDAAPAAVFSGAGAFLTRSLLDKTKPVNISVGMVYLLGEPLDADHPVLTIFQSFFDRSDPLNYNPLIVRRPPAPLTPKHVYMSWGSMDSYAPDKTLNANANSLGLPLVGKRPDKYYRPAVDRPVSLDVTADDGKTKRTAVVITYDPDGYDGHFVAKSNPAAVADWSAFLDSFLMTGTPVVP